MRLKLSVSVISLGEKHVSSISMLTSRYACENAYNFINKLVITAYSANSSHENVQLEKVSKVLHQQRACYYQTYY